eukprot:COSAG04_NODE_994_length_8876_cov_9.074763_2_plen_2355_part_01
MPLPEPEPEQPRHETTAAFLLGILESTHQRRITRTEQRTELWSRQPESEGMSALRALILVAAGSAPSASPEADRRRAQAAAGDEPWCTRAAEAGGLACDNAGVPELCPEACAAAASSAPPAPPPWCAQLESAGELTCGSVAASLCADEACADAPPNAIAAEFRWSCPVLLRLDAGCAHDLSRDDPSVAAGTRVSDVCPGECSGRSGCAPTVLDASFLGVLGDGSGNGHAVTLAGDACADGGGLQLSGDGYAEVSMGGSYAEGGDFSLAFWLLKAPEDVWAPEGGQHTEAIFSHPIDEGSADSGHGGIDVRLSRDAWLDAWELSVWLDYRYQHVPLDLLRDATPKWTHVMIVVDETLVSVYGDGETRPSRSLSARKPNPGFRAAASILSRSLTIGAQMMPQGDARLGFRGSLAMLQVYSTALTTGELHCVYESGRQLVHSGRMASLSASDCREATSTGCTSPNADNGHALGSALRPDIDDGSCTFEPQPTREGEHGLIHVTDDWQGIALAHSYVKPVVICGVVTRKSTTAAIVRMRELKMDSGGTWRFEIRAEQKQCHFATPPPTAEEVSFLAVEAGVSSEGWEAGMVRVHDREWHRVSLATQPSPSPIHQERNARGRNATTHGLDAAQLTCNPSEWDGYDGLTCGGCAAIVKVTSNGGTCSEYCRRQGLACLDAWDDATNEQCSYDAARFGCGRTFSGTGTTDGICQCLGYNVDRARPTASTLAPVVISQVQTYDNRTEFVTSRHHQPPTSEQPSAFFLQVQGDGVWCQDGEFFAEYFDSLDLSGSPATQCEVEVPHWHWFASSQGVPPPLLGKRRTMPRPELFSARWTVRLHVVESGDFVFSSLAKLGSRIIVNDATVLDAWSEWGSTFTSEPVPLGAGYSIIAYEYRSGYDIEYVPKDSYAELSWTVGSETFGSVSGSNSTNVTSIADELYVDVGWLACGRGNGSIHGSAFQSGLVVAAEDLATSVRFVSAFAEPPQIFGSISSTADLSSHLRLSETDTSHTAVAIEYDTCDAVFVNTDAAVGWVAVAALPGQGMRVSQMQTLPTDSDALLNVATALRLPPYFHWRNGSDPCIDRWTGIECRTDATGMPRIIVLDIHDVDLTNQDVPWSPIGQLTALEEISLWNCGLTGTIDGEALCQLTSLQVLALRQNKLHGTIPECMATLPLGWLWLEDNNFHGPLPELSPLGQFLKGIPSRSLRRNRWTPLLASEKQALEDVSGPLGVETHEHDWDFRYRYEWDWAPGAADSGLTATREVSYRQWSGGVPFAGFSVELDFEFPIRGTLTSSVSIGRDGDFAMVTSGLLPRYYEGGSTTSGWGGGGTYVGCFDDPANPSTNRDFLFDQESGRFHPKSEGLNHWEVAFEGDYPGYETVKDNCAAFCQGYRYMGLQWRAECWCGNQYGLYGSSSPDVCGSDGRLCGDNAETCREANAVFATMAWMLPPAGTADATNSKDSSCWSTLPPLVPNPQAISELAADASSQGEAYFAQRFCPGWSSFVFPTCDPAQQACDKGIATLGNAIFDGGDDMYDIGNLLVTSLMGDCANDAHDCALGSLEYRSDFEPVPTNCFGAGGQYQMQQLDDMWVFFTTNVNDSPIDFMVLGNLGADGTGTVTEFVIDVPPHTGFVKRECGDADGDPSVNHMIIVDSSQGRPTHSCDYANGGECTGADSNLDDDVVSGIAPGSPILYLLYSTEGGSCMKEDEHRAIFDQATRCIRAADPFSAINRGHTVTSQALVEVDVDDAGHILFGGAAPYVGWTRGSPRHVSGPAGFRNALQFSGHEWLQLGDTGVEVEGNWTLDCWVKVDGDLLRGMGDEGVLAESTNGGAHASVRRHAERIGFGEKEASFGRDVATLADGWHRVTFTVSSASLVECIDLQPAEICEASSPFCSDPDPQWANVPLLCPRTCDACFGRAVDATWSCAIDGQASSVLQLRRECQLGTLCPVNFFAIGGRADGTAPFPLPIHRLRVFGNALSPGELEGSGLAVGDLLRFQPENSRTIRLSRGTDALEVTWDTFGWNAAAHDHVHGTLDSLGGVGLRCDNVSTLWDRAVASAGGTAGQLNVSNWTSAALSSDASVGLRVRYIDSDACFDLWNGVTCSLSNWPVGTDDCAERLDCEALGWDADLYGSSTVCGSSSLVGEFGSSDMCVRERSYTEAESLCREMGGRLCTAAELEQNEGGPATCGYDSIFRWSWVSGSAEACPSANQSLCMPGSPGAWFSFVPTTLNGQHEIQLRSTHVQATGRDTRSFTILGVFDDHAEMVAGRHATLHHREDGAMLRWNATQVGQDVFVHVSSPASDASYTMTAVLPPQYSWQRIDSQAPQPFGAAPLELQKDGAVRNDLGFDFPFLGLQRRHIWVSSF